MFIECAEDVHHSFLLPRCLQPGACSPTEGTPPGISYICSLFSCRACMPHTSPLGLSDITTLVQSNIISTVSFLGAMASPLKSSQPQLLCLCLPSLIASSQVCTWSHAQAWKVSTLIFLKISFVHMQAHRGQDPHGCQRTDCSRSGFSPSTMCVLRVKLGLSGLARKSSFLSVEPPLCLHFSF